MTSVAMYPAAVKAEDNPFITILAEGIGDSGVSVVPFLPLAPFRQADALHIHWLEKVFWSSLARRSTGVQRLIARGIIRQARLYRASGKPVVWTAHNLRPHEELSSAQRSIFDELRKSFLPLVSDVVVMSEAVETAIGVEYPELQFATRRRIAHPHFRDFYKKFEGLNQSMQSRWPSAGGPRLAVIGQIRFYKKIPDLIRTARESAATFSMLVAGDGSSNICADIRSSIGHDPRFQFENRRLSHAEISAVLASADAAVFNFGSILNSGSVLAALSMSTHVLCPQEGSLAILEAELGRRWIQGFNSPLTVESFEHMIANVPHGLRETCPLEGYSPVVIGRLHKHIYENPVSVR